jgi:hypothetical protein
MAECRAFQKQVLNTILATLLVEFAATIPVKEHKANLEPIRQYSEVPRSRRSGAQRYSALHSDLESQCFGYHGKVNLILIRIPEFERPAPSILHGAEAHSIKQHSHLLV